MAHQIDLTKNSSSIQPASMITAPFITNRKRPSVKTVIGMVNRTKNGFKKVLSKASTIATKIAAKKPLTTIPGSNLAVKKTATAEINNFITKDIIVEFKS